jgi:hypothetical protein
MKTLPSSLVRIILAMALVFAVLSGSVHAAHASNGAETWKNVTDSFEVYGSCSDQDGIYQITLVSSGTVRHYDEENGLKFLWSENGTYTIVPIDADSPVTYSGNYNIQVQNHLSDNHFLYKFIFTDTALGSDGTREVMHIISHIVINANGVERGFDDVHWICN